MKRRNFLTVLAVAPLAPWREITAAIAKSKLPRCTPSRIDMLDLSKWGTFTLTGASNCFKVGDTVRIVQGSGRETRFTVVEVIGRKGPDMTVRNLPPAKWNNLARHA